MAKPSADRIRELLNYDPATGLLTWKVSRCGAHAGSSAGSVNSLGYIQVMIDRHQCLGHRLAWLHYYGSYPAGNLDHKNGKRSDNRLDNLRECTQTQNNGNMRGGRSKTGFKGVYPAETFGKYYAQIKVNGKKLHLGMFDDPAVAHAAYFRAAQTHFGEFARAV